MHDIGLISQVKILINSISSLDGAENKQNICEGEQICLIRL